MQTIQAHNDIFKIDKANKLGKQGAMESQVHQTPFHLID